MSGRGYTPGRKRPPTQQARVLRALRESGNRGTEQSEWLAPNVRDRRGPITRLASRIADLRAAGYTIRTAGRRHGFRVYVLEEEPGPRLRPAPPRAALLDASAGVQSPRSAIAPWGDDA